MGTSARIKLTSGEYLAYHLRVALLCSLQDS